MSLLSLLNEKISLDAFEGPSTQEEIDEMLAKAPFKIPEEYVEIVREKTRLEFYVDGIFMRIWGAKKSTEYNEAYLFSEYMPNAWAIGDNGGGNAIVYFLKDGKLGLYITDFGALGDDERTHFLAPSLYDFFVKGIGTETYLRVW